MISQDGKLFIRTSDIRKIEVKHHLDSDGLVSLAHHMIPADHPEPGREASRIYLKHKADFEHHAVYVNDKFVGKFQSEDKAKNVLKNILINGDDYQLPKEVKR